MKRNIFCAFLALLLLSACTPSAERDPTPEPTPKPTVETTPEPTPKPEYSFPIVDPGYRSDDLTWTLYSNGVLIISGTGPMEIYNSAGPWYSYRDSITTIVVEDGVTSIGASAFCDLVNLTGVTIPDSVTEIGFEAFSGCTSLSDLSVPAGVTEVGGHAFSGTPWLESLGEFAVVNGILLKYQGGGGKVVIPDNVTCIGYAAFAYCDSLTGVVIPDSVTRIEGSAFSGCKNLTGVVIPNSVTRFESSVFNGCGSLVSVIIPDGVTSIGISAFYNCGSLTSIAIPASVVSIEGSAFWKCGNLTDVYYGGSEAQWNRIAIDYRTNGNDPLLNATIHYNS